MASDRLAIKGVASNLPHMRHSHSTWTSRLGPELRSEVTLGKGHFMAARSFKTGMNHFADIKLTCGASAGVAAKCGAAAAARSTGGHRGSTGSPAAELAQEQLQSQVLQQHPAGQAAGLVPQQRVPAAGLALVPAVQSCWLRPGLGLGLGLAEAPGVMPGGLQGGQQDARVPCNGLYLTPQSSFCSL